MEIVIFSDAMVFFSSLAVSAAEISESAAIFYSDRTGITDHSYHSPGHRSAMQNAGQNSPEKTGKALCILII